MNIFTQLFNGASVFNAFCMYLFLAMWFALLITPVFFALFFLGLPIYVKVQDWRHREMTEKAAKLRAKHPRKRVKSLVPTSRLSSLSVRY